MMLFNIPLAEDGKLVQQAGSIVGGKIIAACLLHPGQRLECRPIQYMQGRFVHAFGQGLVKSVAAEIREQQKPLFQVFCKDCRDLQAGLGQTFCHMQEGATVLAFGRRVHDNGCAVCCVDTEVPAETGVAGCWPQGSGRQAQVRRQACQPIMQLRQTAVRLREVSGFHVLGHSLTIIPARLFLQEGNASTGPAVVPKYNPFFEGETFVRSVWWTLFIALGCGQAAAAAPPQPEAIKIQASGDFEISSKLRTHILDEDQMSAFLVADDIRAEEDGRVVLSGNAEVRRIDTVVKGDEIDYHRSTGQLQVRGNGLLMREANIVQAPAFDYNVDAETGEISEPNFWLGATGGAGQAERADIFSHDHMRLNQVTYTGCPCPDPAWYIKSRQVDLHFEDNEGIARHGTLYFKNVPILYSPYLTFPIRKERKSGFLLPTYGTSTAGGMDFSLPYYFNLAPNYDLTLTPRILAKRGLQMGAEFRYLGQSYVGSLQGTYLNDDRAANRDRWYYGIQHQQALGGGLHASFDIRRVSDDDYFRDFSSLGLNEATNTWLPSTATLSWWNSPYIGGSLSVQKYQTLQDRNAQYLVPQYDKLPELFVRAAHYDWGGFDVVSENYVTRFSMPFYSGTLSEFDYYRDHRIAPDGDRLTSYTTIAYPIVKAGWYVTPKVGLHL